MAEGLKQVKKIIPKKIPFRCPNCSGFGTLRYGKLECHSCEGRGFIIINQEEIGEGERYEKL